MNRFRADFKWMTGVLFSLVFASLLVSSALFQASGRVNGEEAIAAMGRPLQANSDLKSSLYADAPDLLALLEDPDFATIVYDDPERLSAAIDSLSDQSPLSGDDSDALKEQLRLFGSLASIPARGTHDSVWPVLAVQAVLLLLLAAAVAFFSRGLGRVVSIGICLAVVSWPLLGLLKITDPGGLLAAGEGTGVTGEAVGPADVARPLIEDLHAGAVTVTSLFAFLALLLLVAAAIATAARR